MSERNRYSECAMRAFAPVASLALTFLILVSTPLLGHGVRVQAGSRPDTTVLLEEADAGASMRISRLVQVKPSDQLLNELRDEVAKLGVRMTALEEEVAALKWEVRPEARDSTARSASRLALFVVVLGISGSFGLQWGIIKRSRTSGIRAGVWTFVIAVLIIRLVGRGIAEILQGALFGPSL